MRLRGAVTGPDQTNSPQTAPLLAIIYNQAIYQTITACYYTWRHGWTFDLERHVEVRLEWKFKNHHRPQSQKQNTNTAALKWRDYFLFKRDKNQKPVHIIISEAPTETEVIPHMHKGSNHIMRG